MEHKGVNKAVYDAHAKEFEDKTKDYLRTHILQDAELFIANLLGKKVLDLGSGPGRDSQYFKDRGLTPLCFDISPEMIRLCQEKGLEAQVGDLENLPFEDSTFDGVWAYTSLLHVPKDRFKGVLTKVHKILVLKGVFYLGMKEGNFEGMIKSDKYNGSERFFALYQGSELMNALASTNFNVIHTSRVTLGDATFLNYLCKK